MEILDKHRVLEELPHRQTVILDLGCGARKRHDDWIGIDARNLDGVDIVGDAQSVLKSLPPSSVDEVHSYHFFEHVQDLEGLMIELARVCKPGGLLEVVVPHFSNPHFYSDYTHRHFFGLYSFSYLSRDRVFRRRVPNYLGDTSFELRSAQLVFTSPFIGRFALKRALGLVFNLNRWTREFYEENLCYLFPCYEIRFRLRRCAP
jgi:SAM-dependent methyltransferase